MPGKRILLLTLGFLVVLLGTTWAVLAGTGAARAFAQRFLAKVVEGEFALDDASVDLAAGAIQLRGLAMESADRARTLTRIESVDIHVDAGLAPREITVRGWELDIDLSSPTAINVWDRLNLGDDKASRAPLPTVRVLDSRIVIRADRSLPPLVLEQVELEMLPDADDPDAQVLRGTATLNERLPLVLSGRGVPENESMRVLVAMESIDLDRDLVAAFAPDAARTWPDLDVAGTLENGSLWLELDGGGAEGETFVAGGRFDVQGLNATFADFPYPVQDVRAQVALSTRDGGSIQVQLDGERGELPFSASGVVIGAQSERPSAKLEIDARRIQVDDRLRRSLTELPVLTSVWNALVPTAGEFDLHLFAGWDAGFEEDPEIVARAEVRGAAGRYTGYRTTAGVQTPGFPAPIENVEGTVIVDGDIVRLEGFRGDVAAAAGQGRLQAWGFIDVREGGPIDLHFTSESIEFHPGVRGAVGELLASESDPGFGTRLWDSFAPVGRAGLDVHVELDGYRVDLRPRNASVTWAPFPLAVHDLEGLIRIDEAGVALDLTGRHGETATVALDGRIRNDPSDGFETEVLIDVEGVRFSPELQAAVGAFSPVLGQVWDQVRPGGNADLEVVFWRPTASGPSHYDAHVELAGAALDYVGLPVPVRGMTGSIHVQGRDQKSRLILEQVRGLVSPADGEPAAILAQGVVSMLDGKVDTEEISAVIQGLPLTPALADGLSRGEVLPREVWDTLRPSGKVDCTFHRWQQGRGKKPQHALDITLLDVASTAAILPGPASSIQGTLEVRDGDVAFRDLTARVHDTEIQCLEGSVVTDGEATQVRATVRSVGEFPLDDSWANLLSGPSKQVLIDRRIRGHARINQLELAFDMPPDGEAFRTEIRGQLAIGDTGLNLGTRAEGLVGIVDIDRAVFDETSGFVEGSLRDVDFNLLGHPVEEFSGAFRADGASLVFRNAAFSLYDGDVRSASDEPPLVYTYADGGNLRADLAIENLTLSRLLRGAGHTTHRYSGIVSGTVQLDQLRGGDFLSMRGGGTLRIRDADLGVVPVFSPLYKAIAPDRRPRFDEATVRFSVGEDAIAIEDLSIQSKVLGVNGSGSIGLDGYVDMVLRAEGLLGDENTWLFVPWAISAITNGVLRIHVYGHLRTIKDQSRFLLQSDPGYQPLSPLPPRPRSRPHPGF